MKPMQHFGMQVQSPNKYIKWIHSKSESVRWHVRKLKRVKYIPIHLLIIPLIILWTIFGMYYAYVMHPQAFFAILMLLILGCLCSFVFRD